MASNKLYDLPVDDIKLNSFKKDKKRNEVEGSCDSEPVYLNTTLPREKISEDDDSDYAVLNRISAFLQNSQPPLSSQTKESNVTPKKGKNVMLLMYTFLALLVLSFLAGTGTAIALGITASKARAIKGTWNEWDLWSQCSKSCGFGMTQRNRTCANMEQNTYCVGDSTEYQLCNKVTCPGTWNDWDSWSQCSTSCGFGMTQRNRTCANTEQNTYCVGDSTEYQLCNIVTCSVIVVWHSWGPWSRCSASCDFGTQQRTRSCSYLDSNFFGGNCNGDRSELTEYKPCIQSPCSVIDGGWTAWTSWETCSTTCNTGIQTRQRKCSNPVPRNGGNPCLGDFSEYRLCNISTCSGTNGNWSSWNSWSSCSSTCQRTRTRTCTNPAPTTYGRMCEGNSVDNDNCDLPACALTPPRVRLVNGTSSRMGRLEVSLDGIVWGTVCDDGFDTNDAKVVCRMLGYSGSSLSALVLLDTNVTDGTGSIFLDDLACSGDEISLLFCKHYGWGMHNCNHGEDVGVSCVL